MSEQQHNNGLDTKGLTALFPVSDIQWRAGATNDKDNPTEALALAYIDARAVQERLDQVCGPEGWQDEYRPTQGGFICRLSIRCGEDWIAKEDGADVSAIEPTKGGVSDSFKRAASQVGHRAVSVRLAVRVDALREEGQVRSTQADAPLAHLGRANERCRTPALSGQVHVCVVASWRPIRPHP